MRPTCWLSAISLKCYKTNFPYSTYLLSNDFPNQVTFTPWINPPSDFCWFVNLFAFKKQKKKNLTMSFIVSGLRHAYEQRQLDCLGSDTTENHQILWSVKMKVFGAGFPWPLPSKSCYIHWWSPTNITNHDPGRHWWTKLKWHPDGFVLNDVPHIIEKKLPELNNDHWN